MMDAGATLPGGHVCECEGDGRCLNELVCDCAGQCLCGKRGKYISDNKCIHKCTLVICPNCQLLVPRHLLIPSPHQLCEKCV